MESLVPVLQRHLLSSVPINTLETEDAKFLSETSAKMILQMGRTTVCNRHLHEIEIW